MTSLLRQRDHSGRFGSLRDSMARAVQDPSALLVSRNTFHDLTGSIEKRRGYEFHGEIADQDELFCSPVITAATDASGTLGNSVLHYIRATYVTAAGETDDLHSSDTDNPGPAEATVEMTAGNNAIDVEVPFHLRNSTVTDHEWLTDTTVRFKISTPPVTVCDDDVFIGWLVYSRSPSIQDETHLGYNCSATDPTYHRNKLKPNGILGKITDYDSATGWWTLDKGVAFGGSLHDDANTVDIMMPDRNGLPIRYYNVYVSTDRKKFYHAAVGISGTASVRVYAHDVTATGAPSTRFPRCAPLVTAVDVTEDPRDGRCGTWPVLTNIEAGLHKVRVTFLTNAADVLRPPGLQEAQVLLGEPEYCYPIRCAQETFPTCAALVCVNDGQGIQINPVEWPDDEDYDFSYEDWRVYSTQVEPFAELTMDNGTFIGDLDTADDNERPYATYYPDRDFAANNAAVVAHWPIVGTFPPIGSANGTADDTGATNSSIYESFRTGPANAGQNPLADPFADDWGGNTPSYEDVIEKLDADGDVVFSYVSSRDDSYANRFDFNFWMQQSASYAGATHAVFALRFRVQGSGTNTYFRPSTAGEQVTISFYDYDAGAPEVLKSGGFEDDGVFRTYYFCVEDPLTKSKTVDGENFLSLYVWSIAGTPIDVDETYCWLYNSAWTCGKPLKSLSSDDRGVYAAQTAGGDPEDFSAWYSGDTDLNDVAVEAAVTAANINTTHPFNSRNSPYEEAGPPITNPAFTNTNVPGYLSQAAVGVAATMGVVTPGEVDVPHMPSQYPGIQYAAFSIDGYTSGVDYTFDNYSGVITSILIPDTTVLSINYDLLDASWATTQKFSDITDGWPPSYADLYRELGFDGRLEYDYTPLWTSTRQDVVANRQHWWFRCDDADIVGTPSHIRVEIRFRTRDGGGTWAAGLDTSRKIRIWDQAAFAGTAVVSTSWVDLEVDVGGASLLNTWTTRSYAIPYSDIRYAFTTSLAGGLSGEHKYFILDMAGWDYNGFDVDYVELYLDSDQTDEIPTKFELLRDRVPRGTTTWTLKNPLREKQVIPWTATWPGFCVEDRNPVMGEWCHIRRGTSGQWPVVARAMPIVYGAGNASEKLENLIGCGDSVFHDSENGTLERVYHVEGEWHGRVMPHDWRFTNYLSRIFFCNPGFPKWNFRYDGVQTWPMGIGWPYTKQELEDGNVDGSGNYDPPGAEGEEGLSAEEDPCGILGEQPAGTIVSVHQTSVAEGDVPDGETGPVVCHDVEYRIVWARTLRTRGRSYVVRSRPRLLTETQEVCLHSSDLPSLIIEADFCPEPQVTHFEIYRNFSNTAEYFLVETIKVDQGIFDDEGFVKLRFEDTIPESDEDLTSPMLLETGRPRAARIMEFHRGRNWSVSQEDAEVIDLTNVSDAFGSIDPEGFWPLHTFDPPMREASAITCLSPYQSSIIAHSRQGMVGMRGLSDDHNDPSAIAGVALHAHAGFSGPDAWCLTDNVLMGMTHEGPSVVLGDEAKTFGTNDIEFEDFLLDAGRAYDIKCIHYRAKGLSQVWFTYTDDPLCPTGDKILVFDKSPDGDGSGVYWKKWDNVPAFGLTRARGLCGDEYPLMGDCRGRLFDFGSVQTDCGVFIESDIETIWFDEAEIGRSHQPDFNYWKVFGHITDILYMDVRKDGVKRNLDMEGIPIHMGGTISTTEEDEAENERRVWNGPHNWGDGGIWRVADKDYDEDRTHHRGIMRTVQYRLYQSRLLLPAGVDPGMTFQLHGFTPFHRLHAPTPANAGV